MPGDRVGRLPRGFDGLIDDSLHNLHMLGHLEVEDLASPVCDDPLWYALGMLAGHCSGCRSPDRLAYHWLELKRDEWERSIPVWRCDCGARYKVLPEWQTEVFYVAGPDGLLEEPAGEIRRDGKGRVKRSDQCRRCGEELAAVIARQLDPQQSLF